MATLDLTVGFCIGLKVISDLIYSKGIAFNSSLAVIVLLNSLLKNLIRSTFSCSENGFPNILSPI